MNDNKNTNFKIVLITNRLEKRPKYKSPEEMFLHLFLEKNGMTYEKIEYHNEISYGYIGKLPALYINGIIIQNADILEFLKEHLISYLNIIYGSDSLKIEKFIELYEKLIFCLKFQFSILNEYYLYLKTIEKNEKNKNKSFFSKLKNWVFSDKNNNHQSMISKYINSLPGQMKLNKIYDTDMKKITEIIKEIESKLKNHIQETEKSNDLDKDQSLFLNILIYSFLKDEESSTKNNKLNPPKLNINLTEEKNKIHKIISSDIQFSNGFKQKILLIHESYSNMLRLPLPNSSDKVNNEESLNIQNLQSKNSFYHHLFTIGCFVGLSLLTYYLSRRKK